MGTRYVEEDAYEQVGADGHVSVRHRLRNAFAAPLKQWAVRILCGCGGLAAFWDNHASVSVVCVGWLSVPFGCRCGNRTRCRPAIGVGARDLAGMRQRLGFDPLGTDPVNDLLARLWEEVHLK